MKIKANDRILFAGRTGSGKTWLAKSLADHIPRLVVIDPKATLGKWDLRIPNERDWYKLARGEPGRFRIMPPPSSDPTVFYETLFRRLYHIGDLIVYIDEAYGVVKPGAQPGPWLSALYTRGRELGIGMWTATQRPAWIPLFILSEADLFFVFRLHLKADRARLAEIIGDQALLPVPDKHGFYVYQTDWDKPVYYSKLRDPHDQTLPNL